METRALTMGGLFQEDEQGVVTLAFRIGSHAKISRRFLITHRVEDVLHYICSHSLAETTAPEQFTVHFGYPSKVVSVEEDSLKTLEQYGIVSDTLIYARITDS